MNPQEQKPTQELPPDDLFLKKRLEAEAALSLLSEELNAIISRPEIDIAKDATLRANVKKELARIDDRLSSIQSSFVATEKTKREAVALRKIISQKEVSLNSLDIVPKEDEMAATKKAEKEKYEQGIEKDIEERRKEAMSTLEELELLANKPLEELKKDFFSSVVPVKSILENLKKLPFPEVVERAKILEKKVLMKLNIEIAQDTTTEEILEKQRGELEATKIDAQLPVEELKKILPLIKNSLASLKASGDKVISDEARGLEAYIDDKINGVIDTPTPSTPEVSVEDIILPTETAPQKSKEENDAALTNIAESTKNLPTTLHEVNDRLESSEVLLRAYAGDTTYDESVRVKATEALMTLEVLKEAMVHAKNEAEPVIDVGEASQNSAPTATSSVDINLGDDLDKKPVTGDIVDIGIEDPAKATIPLTTPQGEPSPLQQEGENPLALEELKARGLIKSNRPVQSPSSVDIDSPQPTTSPSVDFSARPTEPTPAISTMTQPSVFKQTDPTPNIYPTPITLPNSGEKEKSPTTKFFSKILRPLQKAKENIQERAVEGARKVLRPFFNAKPVTRPPSPEDTLPRHLVNLKKISSNLEKKQIARGEKGTLLEKTGLLTMRARDGMLELGKKYNELPPETRLKISLGLIAASALTGGVAVLTASTVWRAIGTLGTFVALSEALRSSYEMKTGEERTKLRAGLHTAGAFAFAILVGSGAAGEAINKLFPTELFKEAVTTPPSPVDLGAFNEAPHVLPPSDPELSFTSTIDFTSQGGITMPEYPVQSGDTLYKIIRENFADIKGLPAGQQEAAIENILKQIKADPASYGISSGDVNTIIAGKDTINLEKINGLLQTPNIINGEGIIEHVQKLNPETIINNNVPPVTPEPVVPIERVSVPDKNQFPIYNDATIPTETPSLPADTRTPEVEPAPEVPTDLILEETKATMKAKIDSIFGTKDIFGTIQAGGDASPAWLQIKEKSIGELLAESSPSATTTAVKNMLGNLSLESGLPVVRGEHVEDYMERALLKISENKAEALA